MLGGLSALLFVILMVMVVFLAFQVQENSSKCKEARTSHQAIMWESARLMSKSETQENPLWKYRDALEAKFKLEQLVQFYGSVAATAKALKTDSKRLETLQKNMDDQIESSEDIMVTLARQAAAASVPQERPSRSRHRRDFSS